MATIILRPNWDSYSPNYWSFLDEEVSDGDTTYKTLIGTTPVVFLYFPDKPTGIDGRITNVALSMVCRSQDAASETEIVGFVLQSSPTVRRGGQTFPQTYTLSTLNLTTNPETGRAWEWSTLCGTGGLGIGFSPSGTSKQYVRITQFFLTVTYTPPPLVDGVIVGKVNGVTLNKVVGV